MPFRDPRATAIIQDSLGIEIDDGVTNMDLVSKQTQVNQVRTGSTAFSPGVGSEILDFTFTGPRSGSAFITVAGELECTGVGVASLSYELYIGTSHLTGFLIQAADLDTALRVQGLNNERASRRTPLMNSLGANSTHYIRAMLATSVATETASAFYRELIVEPSLVTGRIAT